MMVANVLVVLMASQSAWCIHVPPARARATMTGKDMLYNDLRKCLEDNDVKFPTDLAFSRGEDEFLKHLTYAI